MLINTSLSESWRDLKHEMHRAVLDKKHPFRLAVLSTVDGDQPVSRYVVIRSVEQDLDIRFYTDERSNKIQNLRHNPRVSLLFYHPTKMIQVVVTGTATVHLKDDISNDAWERIDPVMRKPYAPVIAPGTVISAPEDAHQWPEQITSEHFTCVNVMPQRFEVLALNKLEHHRARFDRTTNWEGSWIAP